MIDQVDNIDDIQTGDTPAKSINGQVTTDLKASVMQKVASELLELEDRLYDTVAGNIAYYEAIGAVMEKYMECQSRQWRHGWAINTKWLEESQNELLRRLRDIRASILS